MKPKRVQLRRTKGWRKPEGAIVVARPSRWGNPYRVGDRHPIFGWKMGAEECVYYYRALVDRHPLLMQAMDGSLSGHDLACWCPLNRPCHADVLLELVNASMPTRAKQRRITRHNILDGAAENLPDTARQALQEQSGGS